MPLVIKTKSFQALAGCNPNGLATLKSLGATIEKNDEKQYLTIWVNGKGYKFSTKVTPTVGELDTFIMYVLKCVNDEKQIMGVPNIAYPAVQMNAQPVNAVVPLRDAKALYQRVVGTSPGSVYVVVAMSDTINVAAKMDGPMALSVRVEGKGLDDAATVAKLQSQKLTLKIKETFKYMSQHYPCNDDAPPQKVLGAILLGSGIEFNTPLPKVAKVKAGSA